MTTNTVDIKNLTDAELMARRDELRQSLGIVDFELNGRTSVKDEMDAYRNRWSPERRNVVEDTPNEIAAKIDAIASDYETDRVDFATYDRTIKELWLQAAGLGIEPETRAIVLDDLRGCQPPSGPAVNPPAPCGKSGAP